MEDKIDQFPLTSENLEESLDYNLPPWPKASCHQKIMILSIQVLIYMPVALVLTLSSTFYFSYTFFYCYPQIFQINTTPSLYFWSDSEEKPFIQIKGICCLFLMSLFTINFIVSYFQLIFTDPGAVPADWIEAGDESSLVKETKRDGRIRSCKMCEIRKPDRCHHCRECDRCVLKLDHHCAWAVNCVGFKNQKYFLLVVFYATLALGVFVASFWEVVVIILVNSEEPEWFTLFIVSVYMVGTLTEMVVFGFLMFHVWLVWNNMTTLEFCEKRREKVEGFNSDAYSLTVLGNFKEALGSNVLLWFVPFGFYKSEDSGLYFPRKF